MAKGHRLFYLRTPEIILLRRALRIYVNTYQQLAAKSTPTWEKEDLQQIAKAADILSERLLRETLPEGVLPRDILDQIASAIQNYNHNHLFFDQNARDEMATVICNQLPQQP